MLAMMQHPEVQAWARVEIDGVVGTTHLSHFGNRPKLPYVEAILIPVVPLGERFGHRTRRVGSEVRS